MLIVTLILISNQRQCLGIWVSSLSPETCLALLVDAKGADGLAEKSVGP